MMLPADGPNPAPVGTLRHPTAFDTTSLTRVDLTRASIGTTFSQPTARRRYPRVSMRARADDGRHAGLYRQKPSSPLSECTNRMLG